MEEKTLLALLLIYEKFATAENKSRSYINSVIDEITEFDAFLGGNKGACEVTADDLRNYIVHLLSRPKKSRYPENNDPDSRLSPESIAHKFRTIRACGSWMYYEEFIPMNPFARVKPPKIPKRVTIYPTQDEMKQILDTMPRDKFIGNRDRCVAIMLYGTGARISEILNLRHEDIDFNTGQFTVLGKNQKQRVLFMSPKVFKAAYKYYHKYASKIASRYFFTCSNGKKLTRTHYEHLFSKYVKAAGIDKHVVPHSLRHAFARQYLINGGDALDLQHILGHSTLEMTNHYVAMVDQDVEKKMKKLSPVENLDIRI